MLDPDKKIVAVRSLRNKDHATNIPPTVLTIDWNLGKRCNYDCSYCSDLIHDSVSPFIVLTDAIAAVDNLHSEALNKSKKIDWIFTGGEPFIDPSFMDLLSVVRSKSTTNQIAVSSNGSLPLQTYLKSTEFITNLTLTIHPERSTEELQRTIRTIKELNNVQGLMLSVTVMFLAGSITSTTSILEELSSAGISTILRKIRPPADAHHFESLEVSKKSRILVDTKRQIEIKLDTKKKHDLDTYNKERSYYTELEHKFVDDLYNKNVPWNNMAVWYEDGSYSEVNSDELLVQNSHSFNSWICFAGVDSLYIDTDGSVYIGNCYNGGSIGNIKNKTEFKKHPVKCSLNWCTCNIDMTVRKASKTIYLKLIT